MNNPAPPSADPGSPGAAAVERLGFAREQVIQEFGYDSDIDDDFRFAVEDACGAEIEDDDYTGAADAVLLWWRDDDGDLGDALVDMVGVLDDGGFVVLLTPRSGTEVEASDIEEAAVTAGLHLSGSFTVGLGWRAYRLVAPKGPARR
ncbi:MAG: DUF3052 domain-containing protein [Dermatophilaceae bacterium]